MDKTVEAREYMKDWAMTTLEGALAVNALGQKRSSEWTEGTLEEAAAFEFNEVVYCASKDEHVNMKLLYVRVCERALKIAQGPPYVFTGEAY